jgi:hypothetical protein
MISIIFTLNLIMFLYLFFITFDGILNESSIKKYHTLFIIELMPNIELTFLGKLFWLIGLITVSPAVFAVLLIYYTFNILIRAIKYLLIKE